MFQLLVPDQSFCVDVCRSCTLVWFDPAEYDSLPKTKAQSKPKEKELPPEARQMLAMEQIKDRRKQAMIEKGSPDGFWKYVPAILGMPVEFDYNRTRTTPAATWSTALLIIIISLLAFLDFETVAQNLALIPAEWNRLGGFTFLTSFFLHGGILHLAGNVYFLLVFGDNVEDHLGSAWFMLLLLVAILGGGFAHVLSDPASTVPCVGASGGISALLAYYALQFPGARVGMLFLFRWIRLPVFAYVFLWVAIQIAGTQITGSSVAYFAHLGGAAVGFGFWLIQRYVVKTDSRASTISPIPTSKG